MPQVVFFCYEALAFTQETRSTGLLEACYPGRNTLTTLLAQLSTLCLAMHLVLVANIVTNSILVTTSKALVTTSVALVTTSKLSKKKDTTNFLALVTSATLLVTSALLVVTRSY